jgi:hypothetical protein
VPGFLQSIYLFDSCSANVALCFDFDFAAIMLVKLVFVVLCVGLAVGANADCANMGNFSTTVKVTQDGLLLLL